MDHAAQREYPAPMPNTETQGFWDAVKEGRFLLRYCSDCERGHWYPRAICPFCHSKKTLWKEASGKGTIYTYSVMRRAKVPFATAYVTLDEGPTLLTNLVDCDLDGLSIGMRVEITFVPSQDETLSVPVFRPLAPTQ